MDNEQEAIEQIKEKGWPTLEAEPKEVAKVEEAPEQSEVETEAMQKGWKPDGPKSAEEFLRAEPLYSEIKQRGKEIKALNSKLDEALKHISNLRRAGYEDKLSMIKQERANAIARSDIESVDYLDEQLYAVKQEIQQETPALSAPEVHPAAAAFVEKYKDLIQDKSDEAAEIKAFIDFKDKQLGAKGLEPDIHMRTLEQQLHKRYPERFAAKDDEPSISMVEADSRPVVNSKTKSKYSIKDLTREQRGIYEYMDRRGYGGEDYLKQLVELNKSK